MGMSRGAEPGNDAAVPALPWRLEDIDFGRPERGRVRGDDTLHFVLATSAPLDAVTHQCASNLID